MNIEPYRLDEVHPYTRTRIITMNGVEVALASFSRFMTWAKKAGEWSPRRTSARAT
ncbi:MAG: hypothetical protein HQL40_17635 [Alphaproteobacteria bacterium]|nr:hypothetical protein [Alphaproteobacteria bacterium]